MRILITVAVTFAVTGLIYLLDIAGSLGAHPWWSQKVVLIGAPVGLVIAFATMLTPTSTMIRVSAFVILSALAFALARYGKAQFAASFAEDALAGQFWYFGWIGSATAFFGALGTLVHGIVSRRVITPYT